MFLNESENEERKKAFRPFFSKNPPTVLRFVIYKGDTNNNFLPLFLFARKLNCFLLLTGKCFLFISRTFKNKHTLLIFWKLSVKFFFLERMVFAKLRRKVLQRGEKKTEDITKCLIKFYSLKMVVRCWNRFRDMFFWSSIDHHLQAFFFLLLLMLLFPYSLFTLFSLVKTVFFAMKH